MSDELGEGEILPSGCGLLFGWITTSVLGAVLGWILGWQASFQVPGAISIVTLGATMGTFLGVMQWLVIRKYIHRSGWWILNSIIGWATGFTLGVMLAQRLGIAEAGFGLLVGGITGISLGIFQWVVMREQVANAGWWIIANAFAWGSSLVYYRPGISGLGVLYGLLSGLVTGITLLWLLYRPVSDDHP